MVGTCNFQSLFPRSFQLSEYKEAFIIDMGEWKDDVLCWSWRWRISSLAWEEDLVSELGTLVAVIYSSEGEKDFGFQRRIVYKIFCSFRLCVFENHCTAPSLISADAIFKIFWKILTSLKVISCCLNLGRLSTRAALSKRGVVNSAGASCIFCNSSEENINQLFISCSVSHHIWINICLAWIFILYAFLWFGIVLGQLANCMKKIKEIFLLHLARCGMVSIWLLRKIFVGKIFLPFWTWSKSKCGFGYIFLIGV